MYSAINLYDQEGNLATAEQRAEALQEFRQKGSILGWFFVDPRTHDSPQEVTPSKAVRIQIEAGDDEAKAAVLAHQNGADYEDDWFVGFRLYTLDDGSQLAFQGFDYWPVTERFTIEVADNRGDFIPSVWMQVATQPGFAAVYPSEELADEAIALLQARDAKQGEPGRWAYRVASVAKAVQA
jgi:hypothetical protein